MNLCSQQINLGRVRVQRPGIVHLPELPTIGFVLDVEEKALKLKFHASLITELAIK